MEFEGSEILGICKNLMEVFFWALDGI